MTGRKFYKTIFTVEVVSEEPLADGMYLEDVAYEITLGGCSGIVRQSDPIELDGMGAAQSLIHQHSDPRFFNLDEDGNDAN